jgi:hypothetical protein
MGVGEQILQQLTRIESKLDQLLGARTMPAAAPVASDRDLDGPHGDPTVRFKPRDWNGEDFKGCKYSTCSPEFLDVLADALEYFAAKGSDPKKAGYDRKDAARARGWARRIRSGWKPPVNDTPPDGGFGDSAPSDGSGEWT